VYAFVKLDARENIYRIPPHREAAGSSNKKAALRQERGQYEAVRLPSRAAGIQLRR
jgi:hypothetical protein